MLRGGRGVDDNPAPFPPGAAADRGRLILPHPRAAADSLTEDVLPPLLAVADSLPDIFSGGAAMEANGTGRKAGKEVAAATRVAEDGRKGYAVPVSFVAVGAAATDGFGQLLRAINSWA